MFVPLDGPLSQSASSAGCNRAFLRHEEAILRQKVAGTDDEGTHSSLTFVLMRTFYCSTCAQATGLKSDIETSNPLGTTGQLDKFRKHTNTSGASREPVRTVFDSTQTTDYLKCIQATITYGFAELQGKRKNILFVPSTGSALGIKYNWGVRASRPDTIVLVKSSESTGLHAFLEDSSKYSGYCCVNGCALW